MKVLNKLLPKRDYNFYQAKFDYYRTMNMWIVIAASVSSVSYCFSDWYLFGEINLVTMPARLFVLIPFSIFLIVNKRVHDYRIMVPLSYLIAHVIMWDTIWACTYLPDLSFASDGFIIICAIFIVYGIAGPFKWCIIFHGLLFVDILIANTFLHYPDWDMMLILGIPFYLGISLFTWANEKTFVDQYVTRNLLEKSVVHDPLTGTYNRMIMDKLIDKQNHFQHFYSEELNIFLLDIDFFKKVNDTYGHDKGDIVLKSVVNTVKSVLRKSDYVIRWGGEEFIVLLDSQRDIALNKAEEIRKAVEQSDNGICKITISIGVSMYDGGDYSNSIKKADDALYKAKQEGRNCIREIV